MPHFAKSLERRVRRAFIRSLRWFPRSAASAHVALPDTPRILLVRTDRIGDAIVSTPLFALLRERFPDAHITVLLGRKNAAVAPLLPFVDECLVLPSSLPGTRKMLREIRRARYDVAINLLAKDSASASLLTALSGARLRIGFAGETGAAYDVTVTKPDVLMHIVSETSLLLGPLGIKEIGAEPMREVEQLQLVIPAAELERTFTLAPFDRLRVTNLSNKPTVHTVSSGFAPEPSSDEQNNKPTVIINISGSGPEKFWGIEQYVGLAGTIRTLGLRPIFAGSPSDAALATTIAATSGADVLPPTASYAEFAAMLSRADMIVTPDTSIVHLAAALRKPTLMLVASASEHIPWRPWGTPHIVVRHTDNIPSIPVEAVASALAGLVSTTINPAQSSPRA